LNHFNQKTRPSYQEAWMSRRTSFPALEKWPGEIDGAKEKAPFIAKRGFQYWRRGCRSHHGLKPAWILGFTF
jgi:hypothetical protein